MQYSSRAYTVDQQTVRKEDSSRTHTKGRGMPSALVVFYGIVVNAQLGYYLGKYVSVTLEIRPIRLL